VEGSVVSTFDEQVEAGARAMFLRMRRNVYKDIQWEQLPDGVREDWRENFAIGYRAAMSEVLAQFPEYRLRYLKGGDPEAPYTTTGTRNLMASLRNLALYRDAGETAHLEERRVTEWREFRE
jgi:hypothetical protein